jgi:hypothetical protein
MRPIVAIAGATGTGKTAIAISIAKQAGAVLLPLDQLHRYAHLQEGTGLDIEGLLQVDHYGYQILSPWEVSGPEKYIQWLKSALRLVASQRPVVIEGGCTSYLYKILAGQDDPILQQIRVVAIATSSVASLNLQRIRERWSAKRVEAIIEETKALEVKGFISPAGLPLLQLCEHLWKHPEHYDPTLAWAIRISARMYCPSFLASKGQLNVASATERIVSNVLDIQRYQDARVRSVLRDGEIFEESQLEELIGDLVTFLSEDEIF